VRYREIRPSQILARFVECFWVLESDGGSTPVSPERILPDGCIELILNLRSPFRDVTATGQDQLQPLRFVVGQMTRPMLIAPSGAVELIGIRFHPGGTRCLLDVPAHELTNRVVELAAVSSRLERDLVSILENDSDVVAKISALELLLIQRAISCRREFLLIDLAAEIVGRGGRMSIDDLAATAGVSGRQLERRFRTEVGISPKLFCRILRFQEVFRAIDRDYQKWAEVAVDCGYYDQAHLIRDFQQFAAQTPAVLLAESTPLTEAFSRRHRMSYFSNTP